MIELEPEDTDVWLDLSVVYADQKDFQQAYQVLSDGLIYHPGHADFHFGMAYYLLMMGKSREANELLHLAMSMDGEGHKRLFSTFPEAQQNDEVLEVVRHYVTRDQVTGDDGQVTS